MARNLTKAQRELLRDPIRLEAYLRERQTRGPEDFRAALREVVLAQEGGVAGFSRRTGLARTGLYKALSAAGNPSYGTMCRVLDALGLGTVITVKAPSTGKRQTMEHPNKRIEANSPDEVIEGTASTGQDEKQQPKPRIIPGSGKGLFAMADDFNAPLPEFSEYM